MKKIFLLNSGLRVKVRDSKHSHKVPEQVRHCCGDLSAFSRSDGFILYCGLIYLLMKMEVENIKKYIK